LGGTKTEIVALEESTGAELYRTRVQTDRTYDGVIRGIRDLVEQTEQKLARRGTVGIGIPGTIGKATGLVKNANSTWINGKPLDKDLQQALGREVRIDNDANCFAVSEARDGAAANAHVVFGAILGTGTGAGIVVDGSCIRGPNGIAGEWGHNPLPWPLSQSDGKDERPGRKCYCGKSGCIETWLSGPAFEADYRENSGQSLPAQAIVTAATAGDLQAQAALTAYTDRLARSLAHVINILDPDVIVLGGGMGNIVSVYRDVPNIWGKYIFSDSVVTQLKAPVHGDSSGVRGAAWLWVG
jgi:fructokinase